MRLVAPFGIDAASGRALPAPEELGPVVARAALGPGIAGFQKFGLPAGLLADRLENTGWVAVFGPGVSKEIRAALEPLLALRSQQAGKVYHAPITWDVADKTARAFLKRHFAGMVVDPRRLPYYLLLVASPSEVSFELQAELAREYAVGRLDLGDDPKAYALYAEGAVSAESAARRPRRVGFWATRQDPSTILSHDAFAQHLAEGVPGATADHERPAAALQSFETSSAMAGKASKSALVGLLKNAPALLVTASHGIGVANDEPGAMARQGALLTQDWFGIGAPRPDDLVTGADVDAHADVHGLMAVLMACFGGGTPAGDDFPWDATEVQRSAGYFYGRPFTAALPRALLSHPNGPALALLTHVDRAWQCSFAPEAPSDRNGAFRTFLFDLMGGVRVGHAMAAVHRRSSALGAALAELLAPDASPPTKEELVSAWLEFRDARNYLLLGDPAARLSV